MQIASRLNQTISVRYFAAARDAAGCDGEPLPFLPGETIAALRVRLAALHPALVRMLTATRFAKSDEFCNDDNVLQAGDEVLVLPPSSGGAPRTELRTQPISYGEAEARLETTGAGGVATFVGVVRRENLGKTVNCLEYSAHPPLAVQEMELICEEAVARFGLIDVVALHRVGLLQVGDIAVAIAVAARHRGEAFAACSYVIDELKARVPIWKKETTADGSVWLGSTP